MSRVYTVEFGGVSVSTVQDLFQIAPAANKPCAVHGLVLSQSSDVGDAEEEILRYRVIRGHTTAGSGGASRTPVQLDPYDTAAGFAAMVNNTTVASAGAPVFLHSDAFNIRAGLQLWLPPECRWRVDAGQTLLVIRLVAAPADPVVMSGTLYVEER